MMSSASISTALHKNAYGCGTAALLAITALPLQAQIEEVVVTAQKREQSLQDVPININAMSGDRLAELNIQQFDELAGFIPGLEVQEQSANNPAFVIRGITSDSGESHIEPRIAVFQDGVSSSRSRGSFFELHDLERVEVVKGPQSTLFGRAALIGAINVIQRKADYEPEAQIKLGYGESVRNSRYWEVSGHLGGALIDERLAARIAWVDKGRDPYVENLRGGTGYNGAEVRAYRLSLRADLMDTLGLDLIANHQRDTAPGTAFKNNRFAPPGGDTGHFSGTALASFGGYRNGVELGLARELDSLTGILEWDINDHWSFTSISGWREFEADEVFDGDGSHFDILVASELARGEQFSQEIRFNYDGDGQISAFFGANYLAEEGEQYVPLATDKGQGLPFFLEFLATGRGSEPGNPPAGELYEEEFANRSDTKSLDLFGDITWRVSEQLELTAGMRWTRDDKKTSYYGRSLGSPLPGPALIPHDPGNTLFIAASPGGELVSASDNFAGWSWRTVASYQFSADLNLWASYSRGRRPEVIAFNTPGGEEFVKAETLDAEEVDSYEVGGFYALMDNRINISASVYYYEYSNFQTTLFAPGAAAVVVLNAGSATAHGLELFIDAEPLENLRAFFSYGYNYGRFDSRDDSGNQQQFAGHKFRLSPDHSAAIGVTLSFPTEAGRFSITPSYSYKSAIFFDDDNDRPNLQAFDDTQDEVQPGYGIWDLSLRYESKAGHYVVELYGKNLADKDYLLDAGNTGDSFGLPTFIAGPDRLVGVAFSARYPR
ncbi:MAG: TonB-dependent receptor [Gammaproteobacteria bacterium]|nr:TonB-dependent receptor [Gammaproteobacteria bacterium]